jgi:hypothetical protein
MAWRPLEVAAGTRRTSLARASNGAPRDELGSQPPTPEILLKDRAALGNREVPLGSSSSTRSASATGATTAAMPPRRGLGPWVRRAPARTLMAAWTRLIFFGQELFCCHALSSRREVPVRDRG